MLTINLEISNLKTTIQIEVSLDTTFQELGHLLLKHFQLDPKDYNGQQYRIKFIYNKIICKEDKNISSYDITDQSKMIVFISKDLLPIIKSKSLIDQTTHSNTNFKLEQEKKQEEKEKVETKIEKKEIKVVETKENHQIKNPSNQQQTSLDQQKPIQIPFFQLQQPPMFNFDSKLNKFLQRINNNDFNTLIKMGYPQKDAAYALFLKQNIADAQKFLNDGLLKYRQISDNIEEMVDIPIGCDEYLKRLIEIIVLESASNNELDPTLAIALAIVDHKNKYGIQSPQYGAELDSFVNTANQKFPEEFARQLSMRNLQQNGLQWQQQSIYNQQTIQQQMMQQQMIQQQMMQQQMMQQHMFQQQMLQQQMQNPYQQALFLNQNSFMPPSAGNIPIVAVDPLPGIKNKFQSIFQNIPNMTLETFINPFDVTYNEIMSFQPGPKTVKAFNYGRTLNLEQLKFVHKMNKTRGITMEQAINYLEIVNGDIISAEKLLNEE